jgi:hypothetical protein
MAQRIFYNYNVFLRRQRRYELSAILATAQMNAPRCWQLRDYACSDVYTIVNTPRFSYPYAGVVFLLSV